MIKLILLILSVQQSEPNYFELIGKSIDEVTTVKFSAEVENYLMKTYTIKGAVFFHDKKAQANTVVTDSHGKITMIQFGFIGAMDRVFFDVISEAYGKPVGMAKPSDFKKSKKTEVDGAVLQSGVATKESSANTKFEDNPVMIAWKYKNFQILTQIATDSDGQSGTSISIRKIKYF